MANRKLFVPVPPKGPNLKGQIKTGINNAMRSPAVTEYVQTAAKDMAMGAIQNLMKSGDISPMKPMGKMQKQNMANPRSLPVVFKGKGVTENNNTYALSKAPNPRPISLNSGIKPNTFANDNMSPTENACAPLHMANAYISLPSGANNPLTSYLNNTVYFDIQTRAQANVAFSLDIANVLSTTKIATAMNALVQALEIYFYYSSILAYESDPKNKNSGMIALRASIDAQTLSDLSQLGRRLEDTPCPPRMVEWLRYMNGTFLSSNSQGSPLLKVYYQPTMLTGGVITPTWPAFALNALVSDNNNAVFALLRKAIPQWRIKNLYDLPVNPVFDRNFLTIFANIASAAFPVATLQRANVVANIDTAMPYNSYSNNLDGLAYSMTSAYVTTLSDYVPGIVTPFTANATYRDTKYSYYSVSGVRGFYPVVTYPFLAASRQETTQNSAGTILTPHLFGTDKCQNVTPSSLIQSGQNTLDFLFDIDSIPLNGSLSNFNKVVKSKGKI